MKNYIKYIVLIVSIFSVEYCLARGGGLTETKNSINNISTFFKTLAPITICGCIMFVAYKMLFRGVEIRELYNVILACVLIAGAFEIASFFI